MKFFIKAFEEFLEHYFLGIKVTSDSLKLYQAQTDELYKQIEDKLSLEDKDLIAKLQDSFDDERVESNRLFFRFGFEICIKFNRYLHK